MLSINGVSPDKASSYFCTDSYYTSTRGRWHGKGAEALGLEPEIKVQDFSRIARGQDLRGRKVIEKGADGKRLAGTDLTFSAPKSVSVLYEVLDTRTAIPARSAAAPSHRAGRIGPAALLCLCPSKKPSLPNSALPVLLAIWKG